MGIPDSVSASEKFSPAEETFERWRHTIGLFLGPALFILLTVLPMRGITPQAHTLAAIIGWIVVWWICEPVPIPVSALVAATLCVVCGVAPAKNVLAPFADPTIFLFMGSFLLAEAMSVHQLDKRFAFRIMSLRWVGNSSARILFVYGAICAALSMWISNTATTAMMFPIGIGIIRAMSDLLASQTGKSVDPRRLRFATAMMLMAAYASSAGGIGTPVGTPPNLIGIAMIEKFAHIKIPFFQWMAVAVPLLLVMYLALFGLLYLLHRPEIPAISGSHEFVSGELKKFGPWSRGQKNAAIAFGVAVVLWTTPGVMALVGAPLKSLFTSYNARMPEAAAAIIAAVLLFILPLNWKERRFTLTWREAVRIDWGTLLLFGGGLCLGSLMFETKLAEAVGKGLLQWSGASSTWGITMAAIVIAILVSEATSNTASANMVVPVMISLALAAGVHPVPPAMGAILGSSWGFMLPVSTPPNAIVYGSGMIPITRMIRAGVLFDIIGGLLIWLGLRLLLPLVGLV